MRRLLSKKANAFHIKTTETSASAFSFEKDFSSPFDTIYNNHLKKKKKKNATLQTPAPQL
jgi:hypothetical protein